MAQSTTGAEYCAFGHACIRMLEVRLLLKEMIMASGADPPELYGENECCLSPEE